MLDVDYYAKARRGLISVAFWERHPHGMFERWFTLEGASLMREQYANKQHPPSPAHPGHAPAQVRGIQETKYRGV
jgi:hypothetical protein